MRKLKSLLFAATIFTAAPAFGQTAADLPDADPAIWVVKDPDTTIYLFGTFHALDGKHAWFNDEVKAAFDEAGELVLEIPPMDDKAALQPIIMKYALDLSGKPLSEKLSPETRAKYAKALAGIGAPPTAFDQFKPFFATLTLVMLNAQKLGFTGESGAEAVLTKAAKAEKKPIGALETVDFQMQLFAGMPEEEQIAMLEQTLDELDQVASVFKEMNAHWSKGDSEGMAKLMNEMDAQSPAFYKRLITDRNANWAVWVDQRLDRPGIVFVGVGAGHLGGKDSVQDQLAKRGINAARVAAE